MTENKSSKTLFDKIWDHHVIDNIDGSNSLLYIDLHLVHEVTSPQAFESLRLSKRNVRNRKKLLLCLIIMFQLLIEKK